jgi:hypothetical protein
MRELDLSHVKWRKSSRSGANGNCVEIAQMVWRTSSRSGGNGACVEVAELGPAVAVRDSKNPDGPVLVFTPGEWRAFVDGAKDGEFDIAQ